MRSPKIGPIFVALPPLLNKYYNENPINRNLSGSGRQKSIKTSNSRLPLFTKLI